MSKSYSSFEEYLQGEYWDKISYPLIQHILGNQEKLNLETRNVDNVRYAEIYKLNVIKTRFQRMNGTHMSFKAYIKAYFIINGWNYLGDYEKDMMTLWFFVDFDTVIEKGLMQLSVVDIVCMDKKPDDMDLLTFAEGCNYNLIPNMLTRNLDGYAEEFLQKYCPQALSMPMAIPIQNILEAMNLTVYYAPLQKGVFGKLFFRETIADVFDEEKNIVSKSIKAGTILISNDDCFIQNPGLIANTIIHECLHWEFHKNNFELRRLIIANVNSISCRNSGKADEADGIFSEDIKIIEWQASHLSPLILIPTNTGRAKLNQIIKSLAGSVTSVHKTDLTQAIITSFAKFFNVSIAVAKIRAEQLGFKEAAGVFNYVDERYIEPFCVSNRGSVNNYVYTVSFKNLLDQYEKNPKFATLCQTGMFIHVNGMLVINDPKYVHIADGVEAKLTRYALEHIDECCICFKRIHTDIDYGIYNISNSLYRVVDPSSFIECTYDERFANNEDVIKNAEAMKKIREESSRLNEIASTLPPTFWATLDYHIKRKRYTNEKMEELTHINERKIRAMRKGLDPNPNIKTLMALCIGLNLHPIFSYDLIAKAGVNLMYFRLKYTLYYFLIEHHHMENIDMWNKKLEAGGCSKMQLK